MRATASRQALALAFALVAVVSVHAADLDRAAVEVEVDVAATTTAAVALQGSCLMALPSSEFSCCQGQICPYKFGVCCSNSAHCCAPGTVCLPPPSPMALAALNVGAPADPNSVDRTRPVCGAPKKNFSPADARAAAPPALAFGAAPSAPLAVPAATPAADAAPAPGAPTPAAPVTSLNVGDMLTERLSKLPSVPSPNAVAQAGAAANTGAAPLPCPVSCRRYHRRCLSQNAASGVLQLRDSSLCRASLIPPCCRARLLSLLRERVGAAGSCPCAAGAVAGLAPSAQLANGVNPTGAATFAATSLVNSCPCAGTVAAGSAPAQQGPLTPLQELQQLLNQASSSANSAANGASGQPAVQYTVARPAPPTLAAPLQRRA